MKMNNLILALSLLATAFLVSCEPEYDTPPVAEIPEGKLITIDTIWSWYGAKGSHSITEDYSLYAVVTTDESSGNFYREAYIQDANKGIRLRFLSSSSLSIGDSIRVYLKGTYIDNYNGLLQIDSVDADENIIIQSNNNPITPLVLDMTTIKTSETVGTEQLYKYQSRLIQLNDVEFAASSLGDTWADGVNQQSVNHTLTDCFNNTVLVRTSGYSSFADDVVPEDNGTLIGVFGVFGTDLQIFVRTPDELSMTANRCTGGGTITCNPESSILETFTGFTAGTAINTNCWESVGYGGAPIWSVSQVNGDNSALASLLGTSSPNSQSTWLISPEITYASTNTLSFQSAVENYTHDGLEAYILTNYNGDPNAATQTAVTGVGFADGSSANNSFVGSGNVSISSLGISSNYRVAFKYTGNPGAGQTCNFRVDNVTITQ